jgi:hypothetical protein
LSDEGRSFSSSLSLPRQLNKKKDHSKKNNQFENNQTWSNVFSLVNANYYYHLVVPNSQMNLDHYGYYPVFLPAFVILVAKLHLMMIHLNVVEMDVRFQFVDYLKKRSIEKINFQFYGLGRFFSTVRQLPAVSEFRSDDDGDVITRLSSRFCCSGLVFDFHVSLDTPLFIGGSSKRRSPPPLGLKMTTLSE